MGIICIYTLHFYRYLLVLDFKDSVSILFFNSVSFTVRVPEYVFVDFQFFFKFGGLYLYIGHGKGLTVQSVLILELYKVRESDCHSFNINPFDRNSTAKFKFKSQGCRHIGS